MAEPRLFWLKHIRSKAHGAFLFASGVCWAGFVWSSHAAHSEPQPGRTKDAEALLKEPRPPSMHLTRLPALLHAASWRALAAYARSQESGMHTLKLKLVDCLTVHDFSNY